MSLDDPQLLRYSRHILLPEIGVEGQSRLVDASVLVVGAGGLGCPVALYLGASGVGRLVLADGDVVDLTNLQRQIGHDTAAIGENKAQSLARRVCAINPEILVEHHAQNLSGQGLVALVDEVDLVVDASDNFATRHAVNRACVARGKPLVSGAAIGFSGQVAVFDTRHPHAPCYHCLFPEQAGEAELRCAEAGVLSPLVGIIGAMQSAEALKILAGAGDPLTGRLLLWDGLRAEARVVRVPRDPGCPVCSQRAVQTG
jgi:adenylyltransferase/sulfurtransferase